MSELADVALAASQAKGGSSARGAGPGPVLHMARKNHGFVVGRAPFTQSPPIDIKRPIAPELPLSLCPSLCRSLSLWLSLSLSLSLGIRHIKRD